jgi:hypothetical protein
MVVLVELVVTADLVVRVLVLVLQVKVAMVATTVFLLLLLTLLVVVVVKVVVAIMRLVDPSLVLEPTVKPRALLEPQSLMQVVVAVVFMMLEQLAQVGLVVVVLVGQTQQAVLLDQ